MESAVDATAAGVPVQTGTKVCTGTQETVLVGIDTRTASDLINIDGLLSVGLLDACDRDADLMANAEEALDAAEVRDSQRHRHVQTPSIRCAVR